jgi:hypothetical protein
LAVSTSDPTEGADPMSEGLSEEEPKPESEREAEERVVREEDDGSEDDR